VGVIYLSSMMMLMMIMTASRLMVSLDYTAVAGQWKKVVYS